MLQGRGYIKRVHCICSLVSISYFKMNNLNLINFDSKLSSPGEAIPGLEFCIDQKLIPKCDEKPCYNEGCEGKMILRKVKDSVLGKAFVCNNRSCRKQINWTRGTIFDGTKLPVLSVLKVIYCWCQNKSLTMTIQDLGLSKPTVLRQFKILRSMCYNILNKNSKMIGGYGEVVEIDETMIYRRKNHVGRLTADEKSQVWIFGGIDRKSKLCFAEIVPKRDEATLLSILKKHVLMGTTIYSDGWASYKNLENHGYFHDFVNHSTNFLKPEDRNVNTQMIERKWRSLKQHIPASANGENKSDHLMDFLYKSMYHTNNQPVLNFQITLEHLQNDPFSSYLDF